MRATSRDAFLLRVPPKLGQQGLGIENAAGSALRPVNLAQSDDANLIEIRISGGAGVEENDTGCAGSRRARLPLDPPANGAGQFRDREPLHVVRGVRIAQHFERSQYRRAGTHVAASPGVGLRGQALVCLDEAEDSRDLLWRGRCGRHAGERRGNRRRRAECGHVSLGWRGVANLC